MRAIIIYTGCAKQAVLPCRITHLRNFRLENARLESVTRLRSRQRQGFARYLVTSDYMAASGVLKHTPR